MSDLRAKLVVKGAYSQALQGPGAILREFGGDNGKGIIFPFTPAIMSATQIEYSKYDLAHTNYQPHAFGKSQAQTLSVTGEFFQQTQADAKYLLGVMHFLKVVTKMNFGETDEERGTPPPVLLFSAYGEHMYHKVPVLVAGVTYYLNNDIDYMEIITDDDTPAKVPTSISITIELLTQYNPTTVAKEFSLDEFAKGNLYSKGFI
jgi:hypothetical protein